MANNTNKKLRILIWKNKYSLLLVQLVFCILAAIISTPIITKGFYLVIRLSGYSAITRENYLRILKTPGAIIYIIVAILLAMLLVALNAVMMVVLLDKNCQRERQGVLGYIIQVERCFVKLIFSSKIAGLIYFIPIAIAAYMPVLLLLSYNNPVIGFLMGYLENMIGRVWYYSILAVIYVASILCTAFKYPIVRWLVLSDRDFRRIVKGAKPRLSLSAKRAKNYFIWSLISFVISVAVYISLLFIAIFVIRLMSKDNMLIIFYEVYEGVNTAIIFAVAILCGWFNLGAITELTKGTFNGIQEHVTEMNKKSKIAMGVSFVVISAIALFLTISIMLSEQNPTYMSIGQTLVSAHRGESRHAPENTIPAIMLAIENEADYVEIDVRLTKDGQVILMHDADTKRTTDKKLVVKDSTYEELLTLDAGSWFAPEYAGTRIPTLEEVIELCKGKIMLNIELKPADYSGDLETAVAKLITDNNMENQCIITSFNQRSIMMIKNENPDIVTGYIYTFGYSNNIEYRYMDVLSISSRYLTRDVVTGAHRKGIIVAAWTVNNVQEMRRMVAIGVDNIITDNTPLAKRVIYERKQDGFADIWKYIGSIYSN